MSESINKKVKANYELFNRLMIEWYEVGNEQMAEVFAEKLGRI